MAIPRDLLKRLEIQEKIGTARRTQDEFPPMLSLEQWDRVAVEAQRILKDNVKENGPAKYGDLLDKLRS